MSYVLPRLETKKEVDDAIKSTEDRVLVLRFGRETDGACLQLDAIVSANHCVLAGATYPVCAVLVARILRWPCMALAYVQSLWCQH